MTLICKERGMLSRSPCLGNYLCTLYTRLHNDWLKVLYGLVQIEGLVQERRNSSALAMELRLSCINPEGLVQERRNSSASAME